MTMKITKSTNITSSIGVTLISAITRPEPPLDIAIVEVAECAIP